MYKLILFEKYYTVMKYFILKLYMFEDVTRYFKWM